jgi:hypothetical protein
VVPWKFAFRGDIATYRSRKRRREREEVEWWQETEKRHKEHEKKVMTNIERRVAAAVNEMAPSEGLPLIQVPSAHKSSCAFATVPEEQGAIEGVQVDSQRYLWMTSVGAPHVSFTSHTGGEGGFGSGL